VLVRLDLSNQDGGSSALWPLDLFVLGGGGRDPLLAVLLGDRPLTHGDELQLSISPPSPSATCASPSMTRERGRSSAPIQSQGHRDDHHPSITKPTLARRGGGGGGALLAWICGWEDLELYDVETGGNVTGTSMTFGDLRVSHLAWFNPSPDGAGPVPRRRPSRGDGGDGV
jgi:hypothetical protein